MAFVFEYARERPVNTATAGSPFLPAIFSLFLPRASAFSGCRRRPAKEDGGS